MIGHFHNTFVAGTIKTGSENKVTPIIIVYHMEEEFAFDPNKMIHDVFDPARFLDGLGS